MLVGRDAELERLAGCLRAGASALVVGEAGIGKTALARAAAHAAAERVHEGGALASLQWASYLPLVRAFGADAPDGDAQVVLRWSTLHARGGVVLLDDLQWADAETLALLPALVSAVPVVAIVRRGDVDSERAIAALDGAVTESLALGPLAARDAVALVRARTDALTDEEVDDLVERAGGNPLLLEQLGRPEGDASLALSLAARVERQPTAAIAAARVLAVLGRPAEPALLGDGVGPLVESGLATDGARVALRHALVGDAILATMSDEDRRGVHADLGARLPDPGEAARHFAAAGDRDRAYASAIQAAALADRAAERGRHLALAAECAAPAIADPLRLRAAPLLIEAGDVAAAERLLDAVVPGDAEARARVHLLRARARWRADACEGAREDLEAGLALVRGTGSAVEVELRVEDARQQVWTLNIGAGDRAERALELARAAGVAEDDARCVVGMALWNRLQPASVDHLRAALAGARRSGDVALECDAAYFLCCALETFGDWHEAYDLAAEMRARAAALGLGAREHDFAFTVAHMDLFHRAANEVTLAAADRIFAEHPVEAVAVQLEGICAVAHAQLGRFSAAETILRRAERRPPERLDGLAAWVHCARAEVAWLAGRPAEALRSADRTLAVEVDMPFDYVVAPVRAWALHDLGRGFDEPMPLAEQPPGLAAAEETTGVAALCTGAFEDAEDWFERAAAGWARSERGSQLRCLWAAGEAAARAGARTRARARLRQAERELAAVGYQPLLGRVRGSLRRLGEGAPAARRGAAALTDRQREVMKLIEEGLTSAEIAARLGVARATVETHVRHAMLKIGVTSRVAAAGPARPASTAGPPPCALSLDAAAAASRRDRLRREGWHIVDGLGRDGSPGGGVVHAAAVADDDDAARAVLAVLGGHGVVLTLDRPELAARLYEDLSRVAPVDILDDEVLTEDERAVLRRLADGATTSEIATALAWSPRTVSRRRASARAALGARTTAEAVARARKRGLI